MLFLTLKFIERLNAKTDVSMREVLCYSKHFDSIYKLYFLKCMQDAAGGQAGAPVVVDNNREEEPQRNKQLIFIIAIYLIFTMFSHLTSDTVAFNKNVINIIANPNDMQIQPKTILNLFSINKYVGSWTGDSSMMTILNKGNGKAKMEFQKFQTLDIDEYQFQFQMNNGRYIDDGNVLIRTVVSLDKLQSTRNGTSIIISLKSIPAIGTNASSTNTTMFFHHERVLRTIQQKLLQVSQLQILLQYEQQTKSLGIEFIVKSKDTFNARIKIEKQESAMASTIVFAILLFIVSYMEFSAVIEMLKNMFEGRESAESYSVATMLIATLWDAAICVISFIEAFANEQSLILFIMPAFLLCLLFSNLELRVLLMIFQARSDGRSIREVVCKFNLITYGSLILLYPFMKITNLSPVFFIVISLIFLPQIYCNAKRGQRPNISNAYYTKFLTYRFLFILYLKCLPWNIFDLEPNYLLCFSCGALLAFQLFLLWVQKQYGPKKVMPKFLLPPVFNYECDNEINVEEGAETVQCAICLANLYQDPEPGSNGALSVPFRVMRGPCGHKFHGACLTQWMSIKMQCPQCRGKLPPFQ